MYVKIICAVVFISLPFTLKSQLVINEIMATNGSYNIETDFYNFPDWVEISNKSATSINTNGYYLSNDKQNLLMWKMPAHFVSPGDYYIIYCDGENWSNHANFDLDPDGETLFLSKSSVIIDSITFPQQYHSVSFGKKEMSSNEWFYCPIPTPGSINSTSTHTKMAPKALYSVPSGRYTTSKGLSLAGSNIKYTTNGSIPTESSSTFSSAINVNKTMVIKSRSFQDGYLPGEIYANTYFISEHNFTLPVISLSFNPDFFLDNTIGIYTQGTNGIDGNCYGTANWNQPWEREAYFEYFDENGNKLVSQPVGVKISGGCSRSFGDRKSLSVYSKGKYGDKYLDYPFFKQKPEIVRSKSIFLRNSGNDYNQTLVWDGIMQALFNNSIDIDYQSFQPAIVYLNGQYDGLLNIREKINEDYFYMNHGLPLDSLDFLSSMLRSTTGYGWYVENGSGQGYFDLIDFISANSLVSDVNYNMVVSQIDLKGFLNYMAVQLYIANTDWPGNNVKLWKKSVNGKWRWAIFDTDFGFGAEPYDFRSIEFATEPNGEDWPNPPYSTLLLRKLLENQHFRDDLAKTLLTLRNTVFKPEWCSFVVDSISSIVDYEITFHINKYGGNKNWWYNELENFKNYAASRYEFMPGYVADYFGLGSSNVNISIENDFPSHGNVTVNESAIQSYPYSMDYFKNLGIKIEAKPAKGYRFKNWETVPTIITENIIESGSNWKYFDQGGDYPLDWKSTPFNDSAWPEGLAQLGYGDGDESTEISFGPNGNNKIPTYLFRKKFNIADTSNLQNINLGLLADDGAIVYLNGVEVFRNNMPDGTPTFNSFAAGAIDNENSFTYINLESNAFINGENIIACEVHQTSGSSSDVSFDITITYQYSVGTGSGVFSASQIIYSDTSYNLGVKPVFEPIVESNGIYINEIASASKLFKDDRNENSGFVEIYNNSSTDVIMESYYISDDRKNLTRYAIPEGTSISGKSFFVFYADAEAMQGSFHMSFKPGKKGETFYLSQQVGNEVIVKDSVEFEYLIDGYSFGRYTDGVGELQYMANITPNKKNDPAKPVIGIEETLVHDQFLMYPNPSRGQLVIEFANEYVLKGNISFDIYDISGKMVYPRTGIHNNINYLDLNKLENGIYFARVLNGNNVVKTEKIVIGKF